MEIHPPDHAIHTWRDFTIHIATIVVGLLIAIGLEQSVEWVHHRHQRHTAEQNLRRELEANRKTLAQDVEQLRATVVYMRQLVSALDDLRRHTPPKTRLAMQWQWDDLASGAWNTARETQATSLMSYEEVQREADIYSQQAMVNAQATVYIHDTYLTFGPLRLGRKPESLTPADLDKMEASIDNSAADVGNLMDLCRGLQQLYDAAK